MPTLPTRLKPAIVAAVLTVACGGDPTTVEGALARAASALSGSDHAALLEALDERARHALASVHRARRQAARVIREGYPEEARGPALSALGDAAEAESAVALFARRCPAACVAELAAALGAPRSVRLRGDLAHVETVRGTELTLHRGKDGRYGLVWQSEALMRERMRAAAELDLIQKNAAAYARQRALKGASGHVSP